jgi:gag-polyprotein putative aspartyl protease
MKNKIPIRILKIEANGLHLAIHIHINGKSANMILDTGASKTVFDQEQILHFLTVEKLNENETLSTGLGTNSMQSQEVIIRKIVLGKIVLENYQGFVLDLSHVNQAYEKIGLKPIVGVLGSDILYDYKALIDYSARTLTLQIPKVKKTKKKVVVKKEKLAKKKKR